MRRSILGALLVALGAGSSAPVSAQAGRVEIIYALERIGRIASNQIAVWIEDEGGRHVRTLYVTDFTARKRGFQRRAQSIPEWVKTSGIAGWTQAQIDAVSAATQKPGQIALAWDCTDAQGRRVPNGVYVYRIEGNLCWENTVLWTGRITVGTRADSSRALARYQPAGAEGECTLVTDVRATFEP